MTVESGWRDVQLDDCIAEDRPICYGILMPGRAHPGGVPVVKVKDIKHGRISLDGLLLTSPVIDAQYARSRLKAGDVLLSIRGTTGRVARVPESLDAANITQDTARITVGAGVDATFIFFALQSDDLQGQVSDHTRGQAVKGINIADVRKLRLELPPLGEQRKIATILSTVDDAIESAQAVIDQLGVLKKAMMAELLTRGLPGRHTRLKPSELGPVPEAWQLVRLQDVIAEGPTNGLYKPAEQIGRGALVAGMTAITGSTLDWTLCRRAELNEDELARFGLRRDDLLITRVYARVAGIGRFIVVPDPPEPVGYESNMMRLRVRTDIVAPAFVAAHMALGEVRREIEQRATLGAQASINSEGVRTLPLRLPPLDEQIELLAALRSLDGRLVAESLALHAIRAAKAALMSVLLTGKVRVKPDEVAA